MQEWANRSALGWNALGGRCGYYHNYDGLVQWDPGMHPGTNGAWDASWKQAKLKAEEIWVGSLFQTWDAVDEKDFEVAIDVFLNIRESWVLQKTTIVDEGLI